MPGATGRGANASNPQDPINDETDVPMKPLIEVMILALDLYTWVIFASVIMSWLYAFNIINASNQVVAMIGETVHRLTEPVLRPIRNKMPNLGGLDLSPIVLIFGIIFLKGFLARYIYPIVP